MKYQLIAATAAFALMGSAAMAQPQPTGADAMSSPNSGMQPSAMDTMAQPMTPPAATDANAAAVTTSTTTTDTTGASVTTSMVSNGPVPDTAENRAKYGQPMSNAGKRTKAAGN